MGRGILFGVWSFGVFFTFFSVYFSLSAHKAWEVGSFFTDLPAAACSAKNCALAPCTAEHLNQAHPPKDGSHQPYS